MAAQSLLTVKIYSLWEIYAKWIYYVSHRSLPISWNSSWLTFSSHTHTKVHFIRNAFQDGAVEEEVLAVVQYGNAVAAIDDDDTFKVSSILWKHEFLFITHCNSSSSVVGQLLLQETKREKSSAAVQLANFFLLPPPQKKESFSREKKQFFSASFFLLCC